MASKGTVESTVLTAALFPSPLAEWNPNYSHHESTLFKTENGSYLLGGWWKFEDSRVAIPKALALTLVKQFHQETHIGQTALETTLRQHFYIPLLSRIA